MRDSPRRRTTSWMIALLFAAALAAGSSVASDADPPDVTFQDRTTWLPNAHHLGFEASASACDEGAVESISVAVAGVGSGSDQGSDGCLAVSETLHLDAPGTYEGHGTATDDHGNTAEVTGEVVSRLIPFDTDSVPGYPPLEQIPETELGTFVTIDTLNAADGAVRGYEVSSDGEILLSNMGEVYVHHGDWTSRLVFEHVGVGATLDAGGEEVWNGLVYRASEEWWQIKAVPAGQSVVDSLR